MKEVAAVKNSKGLYIKNIIDKTGLPNESSFCSMKHPKKSNLLFFPTKLIKKHLMIVIL